jgi:hypothetical protein
VWFEIIYRAKIFSTRKELFFEIRDWIHGTQTLLLQAKKTR